VCDTFCWERTERMLLQDPDNDEEACFTGIVALGGDGILYEIMQGLQKREDCAELMERKLSFRIVGCGTSNGLAKRILHSSQVSSKRLGGSSSV
jgi:diacylglycerol kinase family enzyme